MCNMQYSDNISKLTTFSPYCALYGTRNARPNVRNGPYPAPEIRFYDKNGADLLRIRILKKYVTDVGMGRFRMEHLRNA